MFFSYMVSENEKLIFLHSCQYEDERFKKMLQNQTLVIFYFNIKKKKNRKSKN